MRIAIITQNRARVGGMETYLEAILPALLQQGHEVLFWCDELGGAQIPLLDVPDGIPSLLIEQLGLETGLKKLVCWRPDLLYVHKVADGEREARLQQFAPAVLYAHDYYGTCLSGTRTHTLPHCQPCSRQAGLACLALYFPRGCGSRNPLTFWREWRMQSRRRRLLAHYRRVLTSSRHMRQEFIRHGFSADKTDVVAYPVVPDRSACPPQPRRLPGLPARIHLVFLGRMSLQKGGAQLLEALGQVRTGLGRPLQVTFAGDGHARCDWQRQAERVMAADPDIRVDFPGWLDEPARTVLLDRAHLLVVPSVWPEPFGLVGPEAGLRGVPAAAFDVGGIPDWLSDGVNGNLATGPRPTPGALAQSIIAALSDPEHYARLSANALQLAQRFSMSAHLDALARSFALAINPARKLLT